MKIVVVGGGPAGLSTALKLNQFGYEVIVLEAGNYTRSRAGEHLAAKGHVLLQNLGVPEKVWLDHSIPCLETKAAWGGEDLISEASIYNPYGNGFILSRPDFDLALAEHCRSIGIDVRSGFHVRNIESGSSGWQLNNEHQEIQADFVVDASGRNSKSHLVFNSRKKTDDELIGISMVLTPTVSQKPNGTYLMVESLPFGWWYSVQLPSGEIVATLMTDASILHSSEKKQEEFWTDCLNESNHTRKRCAAFYPSGKPFTQSAKTQITEPVTGANWILVGDAAISYDPLSSAGILKGLEMGQSAGSKMDEFFKSHSHDLSAYEDEVKSMFANYLEEKEKVYSQEQRFIDQPFWYHRVLRPSKIQEFSILPQHSFSVSDGVHLERIAFLSSHLPDVDLGFLIESFRKHGLTHLAIKEYLQFRGEDQIGMNHFQAMESLKLIGILTDVSLQ